MSKRKNQINRQGIDHNTDVYVLDTKPGLLNKAIDIVTLHVECVDHSGRGPAWLPIGLGDALTKPSSKVFLGSGLTSHTIPEAHEHLLSVSDGGSAFNIACIRTSWAKQTVKLLA